MNDIVIVPKTKNPVLKEIGNYISDDRFYTYVNVILEEKLKQSSNIIRAIIGFLYSSSNYKHSTTIKKEFNKWQIFFDIFCILCFIGLIVCFLTGILTPLISWLKKPSTPFKIQEPYQIALISLASVLLVISIFYFILVFKYRRKNKSLSIQIYVQKKLNTILQIKAFFKINEMTKKQIKKAFNEINEEETQNEILMLDNVNLVNLSNIWLAIQLVNTINLVFHDIRLGFIFRNLSELETDSWNKIINNDFRTLNVTILEPKFKDNEISKLNYGSIPSYNLPTSGISSLFTTFLTLSLGGALGGIFGSVITKT